ncbi:MAG: LamG-like jellyroll fold domain-containing protein, partial [Pseudomonadota bacterium]
MSPGTGESLTLTIPNNISASADTVENVVSGTAPAYPGKTLEIRISDSSSGQMLYSTTVTADDNGNFSSNLPLPGDGYFDLVPGQIVQVIETESNGGKLYFNVYNSIPYLIAMIDHNWIQGQNFPADTDVSINIQGGNTFNFLITTDANGFFMATGSAYWPEYALQRGDSIQAGYNGQQTSMIIQNLNASVDADTDLITGTAFTPGTEGTPISEGGIYINISQQWGSQSLYNSDTTVEATGAFSLNTFTDNGFDLLAGLKICLTLIDSDGNQTAIAPYNGIPYLEACAGHNWIQGHDLPCNAALSLTINSDPTLTASITTNGNGDFFKNVWEFNSYQLQPGDVITVSPGTGESLTLTIPNNISASADTVENVVSGTAPAYPGKTLEIRISESSSGQMLYSTTVTADGNGNFSSNLPLPGDGYFDLVPGQIVQVIETESNGGKFYFNVDNPIPSPSPTMTQRQFIEGIYVAYWGRAADPGGLDYWEGFYTAGTLDFAGIAENFAISDEGKAAYTYFDTVFNHPENPITDEMRQDFVEAIYQNLFDRAPDAEGLAYWMGILESGATTPGAFIATIINTTYVGRQSASADDWNNINAKIQVAEYYTGRIDESGITWSNDTLQQAKDVLLGITKDSDIDAAKQDVDDELINNDLVAYYPFNGDAKDESKNGNHAAVYGAVLTEDRHLNSNGAYSFDGIDDYIVSQNNALNISGGFTASAWFKRSSSVAAASILGRYIKNGLNDDQFSLFSNNDRLGIQLWGNGTENVILSKQATQDTWVFIAGVFYRGVARLYINGQLAAEQQATFNVLNESQFAVKIGGSDEAENVHFPGIIDDVRIYNRALIETEIKHLYTRASKNSLDRATLLRAIWNSPTSQIKGYVPSIFERFGSASFRSFILP